MAERQFEPREVKRILRRAAEFQSSTKGDVEAHPTLRQLQDAAAELGLSPEAVARAAGEVGEEPDGFWTNFWGGPLSVVRTEMVDGQLSAEARPAFLQHIRDYTGLVGETKSIDGGFEFLHECKETRDTFLISVVPVGNQSRITIRSDYKSALTHYLFALVPAVPLLVLLGRARAHHSMSLQGMALLLVALIATAIFARGQVIRTVRHGRRRVETLIASLASEIEQTKTPQAPTNLASRFTDLDMNRVTT